MDLSSTCILVDHLVDHLDNRERPGQQVTVYLDSLHPYRDDQTLEDLIRSAVTELNDFIQFTKSELEELQDTGRVRDLDPGDVAVRRSYVRGDV